MYRIIVSLLCCLLFVVFLISCSDKGTQSAKPSQKYEVIALVSDNSGPGSYWTVFEMATDSLTDSIPNPWSNNLYSGPHFTLSGDDAYISMFDANPIGNRLIRTNWPTGDTVSIVEYPLCGGCQMQTSVTNDCAFTFNGLFDIPPSNSFYSIDPAKVDGAFFVPGKQRLCYYEMWNDTLYCVDYNSSQRQTVKHQLTDLSDSALFIHCVCPDVNGQRYYVTCQTMSDPKVRLYVMTTDELEIIDSLPVGDFAIVHNPVMAQDRQKIYFTPLPSSFPERIICEYDLVAGESRIKISDQDIGHPLYWTLFSYSPDGKSLYFYGKTAMNQGGVSKLFKINLSTNQVTELYETKVDAIIRSVTFRPVD